MSRIFKWVSDLFTWDFVRRVLSICILKESAISTKNVSTIGRTLLVRRNTARRILGGPFDFFVDFDAIHKCSLRLQCAVLPLLVSLLFAIDTQNIRLLKLVMTEFLSTAHLSARNRLLCKYSSFAISLYSRAAVFKKLRIYFPYRDIVERRIGLQ